MKETEPREQPRSDHDTLIRVETKLDSLATDVKTMGDGVMGKLADHEIRIKKIEDIVIQVDPINTTISFHSLQQQVHDFVTTANAYRVIAGLVGGLVMFLLTQAPSWLKFLWNK